MNINFEELSFVRLSTEYNILPFDCADSDLNDFIVTDAKPCLESLLAVTYLIEHNVNTLAFFSVSNDKITYEDTNEFLSRRKFKKVFQGRFPPSKQYKSYPAVKIGRLAVHVNYQNDGIGRFLLDYIKGLFITNNRTGCMYITVDAYKKSLSFYEKNGFQFLSSDDEKSDTRLMYYDLSELK